MCNGLDDDCNATIDEGCPACPAETNIIENPGFESDDGWTLFVDAPAEAAFARDCTEAHTGACSGRVTVSTPGSISLRRGTWIAGGSFELCLFARSNIPATIEAEFLWGGLLRTPIAVGTTWSGFCLPVTGGAGDTELRLWFGGDGPHTVWVDDVYTGTVGCP